MYNQIYMIRLERLKKAHFQTWSLCLSGQTTTRIPGLAHLDAEVVISPSSSYQSTPDGEIAAKKSHKNGEIQQRISSF